MPQSDHTELQNIINDKEARIRELEEQIQTHETTIRTLGDQNELLKNEIAVLNRKINQLQREIKNLKNKLIDRDVRLKKLEKEVEDNKNNQERKMKESEDRIQRQLREMETSNSKEIEKLKKAHEKDITDAHVSCQLLESDKASLQEENANLNKKLKKNKETINSFENNDHRYHLYLGQLCSDLQANMYQYVLPEEFSEGWSYKVDNIREDIDKLLTDDNEKLQAKIRWEKLQKEIKWEECLAGSINTLQRERNEVAHPECLTLEEANKAAEELNRQKKLKGRTSYKRVLKIIEMWRISVSLVPPEQ